MESELCSPGRPNARPYRRPAYALASISGAMVLVNLDVSAVNVSLASLQADLGLSTSGLMWVMNGYTLAFAASLVAGGRFGDMKGRRFAFILGAAIFAIASALSGLAQASSWLVGARVLQGVGAALLFPSMLAIAAVIYPGRQRAAAVGTLVGVAGLSQAAGPLVGGFLVEFAGWRWIFFINVPIGLLSILCALKFVPETRAASCPVGFDIGGAIVVTLGLVALTVGISQANMWHWFSPATLATIASGIVLLAAFIIMEFRVRHPLIHPTLLTNTNFMAANASGACLVFVFFPLLMYVSLFMQRVMGYSPLMTGVGLLPVVAMLGLFANLIGKLSVRTGPTPLLTIGYLLTAFGMGLFAALIDANVTYVRIIVPLLAVGLGMGIVYTLNSATAVGAVEPDKAGAASGVNLMFRFVGGVLGVAITTTVFQHLSPSGVVTGKAFVEAVRPPMYLLAISALIGAFINQLFVKDPDPPEAAEDASIDNAGRKSDRRIPS